MESQQTHTNPLDCTAHEPEDYAHFERICTDIRPWGELGPRMMLGECRNCRSSVSYPKGPSFEPSGVTL